MKLEFSSIKGFKDILPEEAALWRLMEDSARKVFASFGFKEIRTPILEFTELFKRGIGQETDIVSKEMYTLTDSKGRGMTLRPEATASVVRAYVQNGLHEAGGVQKLYTIGPMFRHERPQKGRLRQFHQINAELIGDPGPVSDAEMIVMATQLLQSMGLCGLSLSVNSLGCLQCRPSYRELLKGYLEKVKDSLCSDCRRRAELNPLRVFDCKVETCKTAISDAPTIGGSLCGDCRGHFQAVKDLLQGCSVHYAIDPHLVRGLDYYCRTTFEIRTERLGAQNAVAGGGRYDGLVKLLGGPERPAIGFAVGMERAAALLEELVSLPAEVPGLFVAALGDKAVNMLFPLVARLRGKGYKVEMDYGDKGLKAQLKRADKLGSSKVLIVGEEEINRGEALLRDMETKSQESVRLEDIMENPEKIFEVKP